jgi:Pvc16 N-terminal domain
MANTLATFSVADGLRLYLQRAYDTAEVKPAPGMTFEVASAHQINEFKTARDVLTIFLYRITVNEHQRNHNTDMHRERVPLTLDLHLLLTAWCESPRNEQALLTWTMRELYQRPVLDVSVLSPEAGWKLGDVVQLVPSELSNEDLMRLWEAVTPPYRLSISYIARMVKVDADPFPSFPPVVATQFGMDEVAR